MAGPVLLEIADGAAVLTLNRPEAGNRLDMESVAALDAATLRLSETDGLRALLIRAEGRMFCVGGAINEFGAAEDFHAYLASILDVGHRVMARLLALPCPVVTAIQGPAGGAGLGLALCGDIALASSAAVFRAGYPALGVSADFGSSFHLTRLAGPRLAADMLMTNRAITADEAMARGLLTAVYPPEALEHEARTLCRDLAAGPTAAHVATRSLVRAAATQAAVAHMQTEAAAMLKTATTRDAAEGIAAFLEKRRPMFRGS